MIFYCCACTILIVLTIGEEKRIGTNVGHDAGIHGLHSAVNDGKDYDKESLWDRVQKTVMDWDNRSSGMPEEGREGTKLVVHEWASVEDEAQRIELSQNAIGPSSSNMIANVGTQIHRP